MSKDNRFEKNVIRPAIKEAKNYKKKYGKLPDESAILELKIQVLNPFFRVLSVTFGLFFVIVGLCSFWGYWFVIGLIFIIAGCILCTVGFMGRKKKLAEIIEKSDTVGDFALIVEAILHICL